MNLVLPLGSSETSGLETAFALAAKAELSEIWNSYVLVPLWFGVPLTTVSVGRMLSSCAPSPGESATGFVSVAAAGGVAGAVGDLLSLQAETTHASTRGRVTRRDFTYPLLLWPCRARTARLNGTFKAWRFQGR